MTSGTGSALTALVALPRDVAIRLDSLLSALVHHHTTLDKPQERAEAELLITAIRYAYEHSHADDLARLVGAGEKDEVAFAVKAMQNLGIDTECGACMEIAFTGVTTNEHTCRGDVPAPVVTLGEVGAGDARQYEQAFREGWTAHSYMVGVQSLEDAVTEWREFKERQAADRQAGIAPQEG